jgi:phosphinothricin acetyltransferase
MRARPATLGDAAAIAEIYNQGIEDRVATFETAIRTPADIERWFASGYPIVVVERVADIVAFAATFPYRARPCYRGVAEVSVYVRRSVRGHGAGRLALAALLIHAEAFGLWKLVSRVFVENAASRALVRSAGFREVGIYEKHAQLDGRWRDVIVVERLLHGTIRS